MMLDSLIGLFTKPVWWVLDWIPHISVMHLYDKGVRVTGKRVKVLEPGWYWWIPNIHDILTDNVVRKARPLDKQTLTTANSIRVRVGAVLVFKVKKIVTWLVENEDPDHSLLVEAERCVRKYVEESDYDDIVGGSKELTEIAQQEMADAFGVEIERLAMTDFAETRAIDHSGINIFTATPSS